jgi:hypothetical protein
VLAAKDWAGAEDAVRDGRARQGTEGRGGRRGGGGSGVQQRWKGTTMSGHGRHGPRCSTPVRYNAIVE